MRVGFSNYYRSLDPIIFESPNAPIGDELLLPFNVLGKTGKERGIEFVPLRDGLDLSGLDAVLFSDYPDRTLPAIEAIFKTALPLYLITWECPIIRPENWTSDHSRFSRIFTWSDALIPLGPPYVKLNFSQRFSNHPEPRHSPPGFIAMFGSNKSSSQPGELYSARLAAITWFERHHPQALDFFGPGWDWRVHPCYSGVVVSKRRALRNYRFSICYENAVGFPGYITEKIFDCFITGCVPVYLGASNVTDHIPRECFIDVRTCVPVEILNGDLSKIYEHLEAMTEAERWRYVQAAQSFIHSEAARPFTIDYFVETILGALT